MPKHVLLVIPDEDAAAIYDIYLSVVARFLVQRVSTAFSAFEVCSHSTPDLIITDYPMYVERDRSLVRALRDIGVRAPIIAVSVYADPHLIAKAYEEEVSLFLRAPILPIHLGEAVQRLLESESVRALDMQS